MKRENQTPLTLLEACTLVARKAASLLEGGEEALDSGIKFRETLALLHSSQDLGDGGALLAWVDHELEHAKRFAKTGERINSLVRLGSPFPMPDPAMQLDAVCEILKGVVQEECTQEEWQAAQNAVQMLTEMDDLEDMVLTGKVPAGGFLTTGALQDLLRSVQAALSKIQGHSSTESLVQEMM